MMEAGKRLKSSCLGVVYCVDHELIRGSRLKGLLCYLFVALLLAIVLFPILCLREPYRERVGPQRIEDYLALDCFYIGHFVRWA
jgi:hypothetical protein